MGSCLGGCLLEIVLLFGVIALIGFVATCLGCFPDFVFYGFDYFCCWSD